MIHRNILSLTLVLLFTGCVTTSTDIRTLKKQRDVAGLVKVVESSGDREQRMEAINALGFTRDPRAIKGLSSVLDSESWVEREAAVKSLSFLKDYQAINPLIRALEDSNQFVRTSAEKGLSLVAKSLGKKAEPRVLKKLITAIREQRNGARRACIDAFHISIAELRKVQEPTFLTYLAELAGDNNKYVRTQVAKALGQFDDPRVIKPLTQALTDSSYDVKDAAIQSLRKITNPETAKLLFEMLKNENPDVRMEISDILAQFKDPIIVNKIIRSLDANHRYLRAGAAHAMEKIVHPRAMMPLVNLLEDDFADVRLAASKALKKYHWRPRDEKESAIYCVAQQQWDNCAQHKNHVVTPLLVALNDVDSEVRHSASKVLTELKWTPKKNSDKGAFCVAKKDWDECQALGKHAIPALVQELLGARWENKINAAETLAKIGDKKAVPPLMKMISDRNADVRIAIVEALAVFNDPQIVQPLIKALDDNNRSVRVSAREALEQSIPKFKDLRDPMITKTILSAMTDNNRGVREVAARLLGELKDPASASALVAALDDEDSEVRMAAKISLNKIKDNRAIGSLVAGLNTENPEVRSQLVDTLSQYKDHRAIEPLLASIKDSDADVRIKTINALAKIDDPRAIGPMIKALEDINSLVRIAAARGLVSKNNDSIIAPLKQLLKDYESDVREEARKTLLAKNWEPANEEETGYYCIAKKDWLQCEDAGKHAIEPLLLELKQAESPYQVEAARVLGEIKNPNTIEPLIKAIAATQWFDDEYKKKTLISSISRALTKYGIQAVPALKKTLTQWYSARHTARILEKLGWEPRTTEEEIHYLVARRANSDLQALWSETKSILMKDITSKDANKISNALYAFIGIGREEVISDLLNLLDNFGTVQIAEAYLNSGNKKLVNGAVSWTQDRGMEVQKYGDGNSPVQWGQL